MESVRWLSEREERAWRALQFMQIRLGGELARQLAADSGLSYPDYLVLVALTDRPDGRLRLFELASVLGWEKSRASHHVGRMVDRGLVTKEKCASDRRGAYVVVTQRGRDEIQAAAPAHVATVRHLFVDRLTPTQLDAIGDAAEVVLAAFDEQVPAQTGHLDDGEERDAMSGDDRRRTTEKSQVDGGTTNGEQLGDP